VYAQPDAPSFRRKTAEERHEGDFIDESILDDVGLRDSFWQVT
jgi:hypothetical protein